jgi:hypothetical protein
MLGLNSSATGIGLALGLPLIQLLVNAYGWRATLVYAGTGLVVLALAVTRGSTLYTVAAITALLWAILRVVLTRPRGESAACPVRQHQKRRDRTPL